MLFRSSFLERKLILTRPGSSSERNRGGGDAEGGGQVGGVRAAPVVRPFAGLPDQREVVLRDPGHVSAGGRHHYLFQVVLPPEAVTAAGRLFVAGRFPPSMTILPETATRLNRATGVAKGVVKHTFSYPWTHQDRRVQSGFASWISPGNEVIATQFPQEPWKV